MKVRSYYVEVRDDFCSYINIHITFSITLIEGLQIYKGNFLQLHKYKVTFAIIFQSLGYLLQLHKYRDNFYNYINKGVT